MWRDSKKFPVTPQRTRSAPCSPMQTPSTEKKIPPTRPDSFHSVHKVPTGDSPYVKAKHVQLIDRDPNKAIALFWSAINSGDRVDSALKDMAVIMKQLNRTDEGIEAIKSFRGLCSQQAQESLDNVLIDLYKRGGRMDEHIKLLHRKLKLVEEGVGFGAKRTKIARSQGKKFHISIEQEKSRLLGNLAWAYMQQNNYQVAEELYRKALYIEPDKNKQCNLAICLMHKGRIKEAKFLLQSVKPSSAEREIADSYIKSFDRAVEMLTELESHSVRNPNEHMEGKENKMPRSFTSPINMNSKSQVSSINGDHQNHEFGFSSRIRWAEDTNKEPIDGFEKWKQEPYAGNQVEYRTDLSGFGKRRPSKNMITANGEIFDSPVSSKVESTEAENNSQFSGPLFVDNWNKGYHSQNTFQKGSDFIGFKKGSACQNGSNEGSASKNMITASGEILFGSLVSKKLDKGSKSKDMNTANEEIFFGSIVSSKLESTEPQNDSRFSINRSWRRFNGDDSVKKQQVMNGNLNPNLPYLDNGEEDQRSKITVSGSKSETDRRKSTQEGLNETDSFAANWKRFDLSNGNQDQGSKITVLGSKNETDRRKTTKEGLNDSDSIFENWKPFKFSHFKSEKSWADMVEEEEALSGFAEFSANNEDYSSQGSSLSYPTPTKSVDEWNDGEAFHNENLNYPSQESSLSYPTPTKSVYEWNGGEAFHNENLNYPSQESLLPFRTPNKLVDKWNDREAFHDGNLKSNSTHHQLSSNQTENLLRKLEAVDLKGEGYTRITDTYMFRKPTARRSLCFEQKQKQDPADYFYTSSTTTRWKDSKPVRKGNRLQVFQEITLPDSPRT
ncbi:Tetratricopeptide repeat-containing domain [Macleaya cordata]|uniref:Tetratricopeptide repeat-containing domain n=1 Tax=Macleaya cordata TaxID=56857 RepID=A0A200QC65_MACCD|nr:Tetratricopeptide repeat-containing domain [Macleaya cordata]